MANFRYQALDADGQSVVGELAAGNVQEAVAQLEAHGLKVQLIGFATSGAAMQPDDLRSVTDRTATPTSADGGLSLGQGIEHAVLRSHIATILERGRAIAPALRAYADELPGGRQRRQLLSVCRVLERSDPVEAIAALSKLPEYWIPLLSAATTSADAGQVLREFLTESRRTDDLRQQWWLTLAYPIVLMCLVAIVMTALSIFIIPQFGSIFKEFDLQLPDITLLLLAVASGLSNWGMVIIVALFILLAVLLLNANRLLPSSIFGWLNDHFRPPFGRRTAVARFANFTANLLEAGVSVPDALRIAGFTANRSRMQSAAWRLASDIESTGGFSERAYQRPLTATVVNALAADIPPASRVRLLREVSKCHAERVRVGLSWTTGIVEPLAIGVVGLAVGWTVLALFLPLVKLIEGLSG